MNSLRKPKLRRRLALLMLEVFWLSQITPSAYAAGTATTITPTPVTSGTPAVTNPQSTNTLVNGSNASTGTVTGAAGTTTFNITGGKVIGTNQFHNFDTFNLGSGHTANWQAETASAGVANILNRVLGGSSSSIDGTMTATGYATGTAFFFINPNGVTFTSGATINLPGAFYVSTANSLKDGAGNVLDAHTDFSATGASSFTFANPASFGFLTTADNSAKTVSINGMNNATNNLTSFNVAAGAISISGNTQIKTGQINLYANGDNAGQEVSLTVLPPVSSNAHATISIDSGSNIGGLHNSMSRITAHTVQIGNVSATGGGAATIDGKTASNTTTGGGLTIAAQTVNLDGGKIDVSSSAAAAGAGGQTLGDDLGGSPITVDNGAAGFVQIQANTLNLANGAAISANTTGANAGGALRLAADTLNVGQAADTVTGSKIEATSSSGGSAGTITIGGKTNAYANTVNLDKGGKVTTEQISSSGSGNAGALRIDTQTLNIGVSAGTTGNSISTATKGGGAAGALTLTNSADATYHALNSISMIGGTLSSATAGAGNAHDLSLATRSLTLNNSQIQTNSSGGGQAADVTVNGGAGQSATRISLRNGSKIYASAASTAGHDILLDAGQIILDGANQTGEAASTLTSATLANNAAGNITLQNSSGTAGSVAVNGGSTLSVTTAGAGSAGAINIGQDGHIGTVTVAGAASSITAASTGTGNAGQVKIKADTVTLSNGGAVSANSGTGGTAGAINVSADTLNVGTATDTTVGSTISATTAGNANAGTIAIGGKNHTYATQVNLDKGGVITTEQTSSSGSGNAGALSIDTQALNVGVTAGTTGNRISAANAGSGTLGALTLTNSQNTNGVLDSINMVGGTIDASTHSAAAAQSLTLKTQNLSLDHSTITTASSGAGAAGAITINAGDANHALTSLVLRNGSTLTSSANGSADAGTMTLVAGKLIMGGAYATNGDFVADSGATTGGNILTEANGGASAAITITNAGSGALTQTTLDKGSRISSRQLAASASGAGNITLTTQSLDLGVTGGGASGTGNAITAASAGGYAGDINIANAPGAAMTHLKLVNGQISTRSSSGGNAKNLSLHADSISMSQGSSIDTSAAGGSAYSTMAGNISLDTQTLTVGATGDTTASTITSATNTNGNAGAIRISNSGTTPGSVTVNQGTISSSAQTVAGDAGSGLAGLVTIGNGGGGFATVDINGGTVSAAQGASASRPALATGNYGQISIQANESIRVRGGGKITTENAGAGAVGSTSTANGDGDIMLKTNKLALGGTFTTAGAFVSDTGATTGGTISATTLGSSKAGDITITTASGGALTDVKLDKGGQITTSSGTATASGAAGNIKLLTQQLAVGVTGAGTTRSGGSVKNAITSDTYGSGAAGAITIANSGNTALTSLTLNGGKISTSQSGTGSGNAQNINLSAQSLTLQNASEISSSSGGSGATGNIMLDGGAGQSMTMLTLSNGSKINTSASATSGGARAGTITLDTNNLILGQANDANASSIASTTNTAGDAGAITIKSSSGTAGDVALAAGSTISTSTSGSGAAAAVNIGQEGNPYANVRMSGRSVGGVKTGGIQSQALDASSGKAAAIKITASNSITVNNGAKIATDNQATSVSSGASGDITLRTANLTVGSADDTTTGSAISATTHNSVAAGKIDIANSGSSSVLDSISMNGGTISTSTSGSGYAQNIELATKRLTMANNSEISSSSSSTGNTGSVTINAGSNHSLTALSLSGGSKINTSASGGNASSAAGSAITIDTQSLTVGTSANDASAITSSTNTNGDAGSITIRRSDGSAGDVTIYGAISSSAQTGTADRGAGKAGAVTIGDTKQDYNTLRLDGGTISAAAGHTSGDAGNITLKAAAISLANQSRIITSSKGAGKAGTITLTADGMSLTNSRRFDAAMEKWGMSSASDGDNGIQSTNEDTGAGGAINITVSGALTLANSSITTSANSASKAGMVTIKAGSISLDPSYISSSNSGAGDAGELNISSDSRIGMIGSALASNANQGNAGNISVIAPDALTMTNSVITTSVHVPTGGTGSGRGGNISLDTYTLLMQTGFIQANTDAPNQPGGQVHVDKIKSLIASGNRVFNSPGYGYEFSRSVWGVVGFNVIQAYSKSGVSGSVTVAALPNYNLTGLSTLFVSFVNKTFLPPDLCNLGTAGTLTVNGHGGLPDAYDDARIDDSPLLRHLRQKQVIKLDSGALPGQ